jgi:hypothetical protein
MRYKARHKQSQARGRKLVAGSALAAALISPMMFPESTNSNPAEVRLDIVNNRMAAMLGESAVAAVVKIDSHKAGGQGTGVVIRYATEQTGGQTAVVTAAHVWNKKDGTEYSCADQYVYYPSTGSEVIIANDLRGSHWGSRSTMHNNNSGLPAYAKLRDTSLHVPYDQATASRRQAMSIQKNATPGVGEGIMAMGFGSRDTPGSTEKVQLGPMVLDEHNQPNPERNRPVGVPGIVLETGGSVIYFLTGKNTTLPNDPINNKNTHRIMPGDSGGPVFDAKGMLIGVVQGYMNDTTDGNTSFSAQQIEKRFGMRVPSDQEYGVGVAQQIDYATISALQRELQPCTAA